MAAAKNEALAEELVRLRAERDYLLDRSMRAGLVRFGPGRDTGVSSNALVRYALTSALPSAGQYPSDTDDLRACYNARDKAPEHLKARMDHVLDLYRAKVGERYPEVLEGDGWLTDKNARRGTPVSEFEGRLGEFAEDS